MKYYKRRNPQSMNREQPHSFDENISNGVNSRPTSATETSTHETNDSIDNMNLGQFQFGDCDDDRNEHNNISIESIDGGNDSAQYNNDTPRSPISSTLSDADIYNDDSIQKSDHAIGLQRVPSLSLSTYSGYDTEEDEDGVIRRFHDQARSSLHMNLSLCSDDDDSVYSAVNTEDSERTARSGGFGAGRKKKKRPADHIKDAIHGMRKAHNDAQRQRSTRQFLAMSEGGRTAHSFTEAICLSSWCDFNSGRGMVVMLGVLIILVAVVVALIKFEHLTGGVWTLILGLVVILLRRFWVPVYWLVWGQFVEKRRRRNMQKYDSLYGGRGRAENFEKPDRDENESELNEKAEELENDMSNNEVSGELA